MALPTGFPDGAATPANAMPGSGKTVTAVDPKAHAGHASGTRPVELSR